MKQDDEDKELNKMQKESFIDELLQQPDSAKVLIGEGLHTSAGFLKTLLIPYDQDIQNKENEPDYDEINSINRSHENRV